MVGRRRVRWVIAMISVLGACADDPPDAEGSSDTGRPSPMGSTGVDSASSDGAEPDESTTRGPDPSQSDGGDPVDTSDDGSELECEIGQTDPSDVIMIGDSYLAITSVPADLFDHARDAGSLAADQSYRRYDQGGTQMSNGQIPGQLQVALAEDPSITTVIMTGGGNDVLLGTARSCLDNPPPDDPECVELLQAVFDAAEVLLADMADAGIEDVVYFFYPHLPEGGFVMGAKDETLDYAYPFIEEVCATAPLHCVFVDTRPAFEGHQDEYFIFDGVHPNAAGSAVIAELVWSTMVDECIGQ